MRTVTFADEAVVDLLNEKFVAVWNDHNPTKEGAGAQGGYTREEMEAYPHGGGGGNVRTYVVLADGTTVSELQGYWPPARMREELAFGLGLTRDNASARHAGLRATLEAEARRLEREHPDELRKPVASSAIRREIAALRLRAQGHAGGNVGVKIAVLLELARAEASERGVIK